MFYPSSSRMTDMGVSHDVASVTRGSQWSHGVAGITWDCHCHLGLPASHGGARFIWAQQCHMESPAPHGVLVSHGVASVTLGLPVSHGIASVAWGCQFHMGWYQTQFDLS